MLSQTAIPLNDLERSAITSLYEAHPDAERASLTRRDPNESGPVIAEIDGSSWLVHDDGTIEEA